jgi:hypothetical protein
MIEFRPFEKILGGFAGRGVLPWESDASVYDFIQLKQVHGDTIHTLQSERDLGSVRPATEGDAMISALKGKALAIRTADCVPILLAHPQGVVAVVHAGWRGTAKQILKKTLGKMRVEFGLGLEEVSVAIGPAICQSCYTVGEEVAELFHQQGGGEFLRKAENSKYLLDLKGLNRFQARELGVPEASIRVFPECTYCRTDLYYSHRHAMARGETNSGRNYSWVSLTP